MASHPQDEAATPLSAILLMVSAGALFSCLDASAKYLVLDGMPALFVSWVRFAGHFLIAFVLFRAWRRPANLATGKIGAQVIRGVFLFGSTICNFLALQTLQLAETISIFFSAPMVITAMAGPFLGEWAGWRRWLAILAGFAGVLVMMRPGSHGVGIGHLYALGAVLSYGAYAIMTRRMGGSESAESLIFYSALTPTVLLFPAVPIQGVMPASALQWALLAGLGVFGGVGHWLLIKAFMRATAFGLAPYQYVQMLWMVILGWSVFGQLPGSETLAGATIIVLSGLYILNRERQLRKKAGKSALPAKNL